MPLLMVVPCCHPCCIISFIVSIFIWIELVLVAAKPQIKYNTLSTIKFYFYFFQLFISFSLLIFLYFSSFELEWEAKEKKLKNSKSFAVETLNKKFGFHGNKFRNFVGKTYVNWFTRRPWRSWPYQSPAFLLSTSKTCSNVE